MIDDAVTQVELVLQILREPFEGNIFIEAFPCNLDLATFVGVQQRLIGDEPSLDSGLVGLELDVKGLVGLRG